MTVPERMRVARLYGWGDVRVEEAAVPAPDAGELLIRVEACGVCGSDALAWYVARKAPAVLGHEPAGVVVAVGAGVASFREGDRVFAHHHAPCLACEECRRGLWSSCATWKRPQLDPGGFAEYARVRAESVARDTLPLPDVLDFEAAVFIEPLATCIRALKRRGRIEPGDATLIVGLGAMGQLMVPLARAYGARIVLGSDFVAGRRELAVRRGADAAFDAAGDVAAAVRSATGGRGADVVVVCPGDARAVRAGLEAAAPGGRVVCFTPLPPGESVALEPSGLYFREVTLTQSYSCGPDETREALALLADGTVEARSLVTHRAGLDGVAGALERAAGKGAGLKTVIHPHAHPAAAPGRSAAVRSRAGARACPHRAARLQSAAPSRTDRRSTVPTRDEALALLEAWVDNPSLRNHMKAVEAAVRFYARKFGEDEDTWGLAGLLHDLDWERHPDQHPLKAVDELRRRGYPEEVLHAILAHRPGFTGVEPETPLDRTLFACDELTGLITATALMRPNGIDDLAAKSVMKKFKDPAFARGVDREEVRHGTALLGIELNDHIQNVIEAMRAVARDLGLTGEQVQAARG